ncbi:MAG: carbon-nitrogen hydrolase family protein [Armatimonadetes bacterium]|nr:carbon-nitrogen hydrolase family protein [Armatimonadota bacterium]
MGSKTVLASLNRRPAGGGVCSPAELDALMADTEPWVQRAARMGARVLCFTEIYPQLPNHGRRPTAEYIEPADGGSLPRAVDLARRYDIDLVWPRFERGPDGCHNVSIYIDRHGEVLGRYRKMFPTLGEMDDGILPGTEPLVIETEYGRVGFAICFDLNYQELRDAYRPLRPDVIFFSSMYRGGVKVPFWALDVGCYMVSSVPTELGYITDRRGQVLERATYEALITAAANLNSVQLHMDYNWDKMDAMLAKYGPRLRFDYATEEARYQISSETVPIGEIVAEFELMDIQDYFAEARRRRRAELGLG